MNDNLAPVFLDNKPVSLKDPRPKLSAILSASGRPETTDVKWLQFQPNTPGKSLRSEEVLDRTTDPTKPIYLTSAKGQWDSGAGGKPKESDAGFTPRIAPAFGETPKSGSATGAPKKAAATDEDQDSEGMQDDAEAGGESDDDKPEGDKSHRKSGL